MKNTVLASGIALALLAICRLGVAQQTGYLPSMAYGSMAENGQPMPGQQVGYFTASPSGAYGNEGVCGECESANCDRCRGCAGGCGCGRRGGDHMMMEFFGDALYLRASNAEVAYSVPINGPIVAPPAFLIQEGPVGVVDQDFELGFRAGGSAWISDWSAIRGQYTWFESEAEHASDVVFGSGLVLRSLVQHPGTQDAAIDSLSALATHEIKFQRADIDYRTILLCSSQHEIVLVGGVCYTTMEQDFYSEFVNNEIELVDTDIQFEGAGLRIGIEAERHACNTGLMVYGRGYASFVAGQFEAAYLEGVSTDWDQIDTSWEANRLVSILDLELGIGWVSPNGCFRATAGYMASAWLNTLTTDHWIQAVHHNDFVGLDDKMTFDGFTGRVELRF